jgi:hypothetical protein
LHLARIDDGKVRRRVYDRVANLIWQKGWKTFVGWGVVLLVSLGFWQTAENVLPIKELVTLATRGSAVGAVIAAVVLLYAFHAKHKEAKEEPAEFSLADYIRVPDYEQSVGAVHQTYADLRKVLAVTPRINDDENSPIVIFIDDLDRCSPRNVAAVVEGISLILASDLRCLFVIGMDPQMVAAALESAHGSVRRHLPQWERTVPLGWRFMDKFVQLPFTIPPSTRLDLDQYLGHLVGVGRAGVAYAATIPAAARIDATKDTSPAGIAPSPAGAMASAAASAPPSASLAPAQQASQLQENPSVGIIVRRAATFTSGNPRELKRLANIARLYLELRNSRRRVEPTWRAPNLDQYARWIALTLRWPDMMRWLQWGIDEAAWSASEAAKDLVARRLRVLEDEAMPTADPDVWRVSVAQRLKLPLDGDWLRDPKLFEFFDREADGPRDARLSAAAELQFW